jgi:hypothetical protein
MISKRVCAVEGCAHPAKYFMGWYNGKGKHFGFVCSTHDKYYGRGNLLRCGMSMTEAVLFERYLKETEEGGVDFTAWMIANPVAMLNVKYNYAK